MQARHSDLLLPHQLHTLGRHPWRYDLLTRPRRQGRKGPGAIQKMLFVISDSPAQAVEVTEQVAATSSTKYVLIDSGATTSGASDSCPVSLMQQSMPHGKRNCGPSMARPFDTR